MSSEDIQAAAPNMEETEPETTETPIVIK